MDRILRIDKPKTLQGLLCFFNLYHPYKIWSYNRRNERYAHIRKCTYCNKLQKETWRGDCYGTSNGWQEIEGDKPKEPES